MKKEKDQIVFGIHAVTEAIDAGKELEKVMIKSSRGSSDIFSELRKKLIDRQIPFQHVPIEKLNSITRKNHQGVIAYISKIAYAEIDFILPRVFEQGKVPLVLVLDQVSDVRNFGAIARTAECAGVDAIVVPFKGSARITAEALKTSAGALHNIPVCRHPDLKQTLEYLKDSGLQIYAATEKAESTFYETDFRGPAALVLGAEDVGISPQLLKLVDHSISIPQFGKIESLNVSVAAGVMIYEVIRQRLDYAIQGESGD